MQRYNSIDILRALAILGMVQTHLTTNLSLYYDGKTTLYALSELAGSFPAPIFTFLVGVSLYLSHSRRERAGCAPEELFERNLRRGLAIFFLGLLFAAFIWMPVEVFNWDILTLIGAGVLIVFPLRRLSSKSLFAIAAGILLLSPVIRIWTEYPRYWDAWGEYVNPFNLKGVVFGFIANGYFPLFPWLVFPLVGYAAGKIVFHKETAVMPRSLPLAGLALIGLSAAGLLGAGYYKGQGTIIAGYLSEFSFYPASTTFILMSLGITVVSFWGLFKLFDGLKTREGLFLTFCRRYSRFAFTTYVVHHAVHVWPLLIAASIAGKRDQWYYYGEVVPTGISLLFFVIFTVLFYLFLVFWEKRGGKYGFEWLLERLAA